MLLTTSLQTNLLSHFEGRWGKVTRFLGSPVQGITVPTLEEVLDEFIPSKPDLIFFFDMKDKNAVKPAFEVIEKRGMVDRVILGAVRSDINQQLFIERSARKLDIIPIAADISTMMKLSIAYFFGRISSVQIKHDILGWIVRPSTVRLLSKQLFDAAHSRGALIALFGESLNDPEIMQRMIDWKADIIVADRPDLLREMLDKLAN